MVLCAPEIVIIGFNAFIEGQDNREAIDEYTDEECGDIK